jgi:hypothetical protein
MFLPVILMRELGIPGVIAFAIPNVVGAAALGWVIRSAEQSRRMIAENREAFVWFSLITIIYHAYFAAWMIRRIAGPEAGIAIGAIFIFFWFTLQWQRGGNFLACTIALIVSAVVMAWGFSRGDLPYLAQPVGSEKLPVINNLFLAPAWLLGFLCCPYLDLTFHAARQAMTKNESRAGFTIGFGIVFAAMLVLTVCYSGWLVVGFNRDQKPQLALILAVHLIVQSCLTCALHAREIGRVHTRFRIGQFLAFSVLLLLAVFAGVVVRDRPGLNGISLGELIYRGFLGFYGLIFPAFIWLRLCKPKRTLARVAIVIVIAAPMFVLGFFYEQMLFFVPGVLIVVLSKFLPDGGRARSSARSSMQ